LRVFANFLDLAGLAGIAMLATAFARLASGSSEALEISLTGFAELKLDERAAALLALLIAGVFVLKSLFSIWLNLRTSLLVAKIESKNANLLARHFFTSRGVANLGSQSVSELQNRFLYSCTALSDILNARVTMIAEGSLIIALFGVFLIVNPVATVALFGFLGSVFWVLGRLINFRIDRNSTLQVMGFEASLSQTRDLFGIRREVGLAGLMPSKLDGLARVRELGALGYNVNYTLRSTPRFVVETSLILGIFAFIAGVVVFSDLASQAVTIAVFLTGGLRVIASALPLQAALTQIRDGSVRAQLAFEEMISIRSLDVVEQNPMALKSPKDPTLVIRNLSFGFEGQSKKAIDSLDLSVEAFSKVAIVGKSGAGKSTLFDLLSGQLKPNEGSIRIGGIDPVLVPQSTPGFLSIVPQRPHLISASLAENVSLRSLEETDQDLVEECLRKAGLSQFASVRDGLVGKLNADLSPLSGGEIQRLGLARALYQKPKILLLDEATSALDAETEALVSRALDSLKSEMTILLIAHRLSTVKNADLVVYLHEGRIKAQGSFEAVKALVPDFAQAAELMDLNRK
jgi:ATP-binding cassette subfamily C protein